MLERDASDRQLRLYSCESCHLLWQYLSPKARQSLSVSERFAEGHATDDERRNAFRDLVEASGGEWMPEGSSCTAFVNGLDYATVAVALISMHDGEVLVDRWNGRVIAGYPVKSGNAIAERAILVSGNVEWCCAWLQVVKRDLTYGSLRRMWRTVFGRFRPPTWKDLEKGRRLQRSLIHDIFGNPFCPVAFDSDWRTTTAVQIAKGMYDSRDFAVMMILADALQDAGCESATILDHCRGVGPHVRGCWVVDLVLGNE
jgi:hypothetical protein